MFYWGYTIPSFTPLGQEAEDVLRGRNKWWRKKTYQILTKYIKHLAYLSNSGFVQ